MVSHHRDAGLAQLAEHRTCNAVVVGSIPTPGSTCTFSMSGMSLSEREQAVLSFEQGWWSLDNPKETLIRERFQVSPEVYYQELNALIDKAEALSADPLLVRRLRRERARRRSGRLGGTVDVSTADSISGGSDT